MERLNLKATKMKNKKFRIQYTRTVTSDPEYATLHCFSKNEAHSIFYAGNPTYCILNTKEIK